MKDVVIYGAGSVGRLSEQIIRDINQEKKQYNLLGFLDDNPVKHTTLVNNLPVLGSVDWLTSQAKAFVALGFSSPVQKFSLIQRLKKINHRNFAKLIHPKAWVSKRVEIGAGSIIYPGVCIDVDVKIGSFCLLNKLCTLGHDTIVGNYATIAPGVNIGGFNQIDEGCDFGINACSIQKIKIGKWATIGAGAVIIRDVPDNAVVVGNPGREIKKNN